MVWCIGNDGTEEEIPREQLRRIWSWDGCQLRTKLAMQEAEAEIVELWRAEGLHVWSTGPVVFRT